MRKRRIGYAAWLLLAACMYFFENNTGTRVVLLCSLVFPLVPSLRTALFSPDEPKGKQIPEPLTAMALSRREPDEPDEIRQYIPGDPVQRIHWKLSAKKDELLVRGAAAAQENAEEPRVLPGNRQPHGKKRLPAAWPAAGLSACILLLMFIPEARMGFRELCNRLFAASEAVNRYTYQRFAVPEGQGVLLAAFLLLCILVLLSLLAAALRSRLAVLGLMGAFVLFQVYFGLSFPAWMNILPAGLSALWMMRRPLRRKPIRTACMVILSVSLAVILLFPGADAATEAASEAVRDHLSRISEQIMGTLPESPAGETETRHVHPRSMESGRKESGTEQEFRLVSVEEEQISMPHWIDWMKAILLLLLAAALTALPFTPFLLLDARKKQAQRAREVFASKDVSEAVRAVFRRIILWLETTGHGAGNRLYRDWSSLLPDNLPAGYAERFARCAEDCEEAVYSNHEMPEQKRQQALDLLKETEAALWKAADWKQRLRLKYWMCLTE